MTHRLHQTSLILSHKYIHNKLFDTAVTSVTSLSFSDYSLICIDAYIHSDN